MWLPTRTHALCVSLGEVSLNCIKTQGAPRRSHESVVVMNEMILEMALGEQSIQACTSFECGDD